MTVEATGGRNNAHAQVKVSSPDQVGLGCDLARVLFDFGLLVDAGDFSTDGSWCFLLFTARSARAHLRKPPWALLRQRLEAVCPSARTLKPRAAKAPQVQFVLRVDAEDRFGLLHDVTAALWERELTVHRAVVTTSPADRAVDLFYVSDNRRELPAEGRQHEICDHVSQKLGESREACQFTAAPVLTGPSTERALETPFPFRHGDSKGICDTTGKEAVVTVDHLTSRAHTVLDVKASDRQGLFYDCMRCMKDLGVSVSYGRVLLPSHGLCGMGDGSKKWATCEVVLFLSRIRDESEVRTICSELKSAVERPWTVGIANVGVDGQCTQLSVRASLDAAGLARPRVLLDVTEALRRLSVWVFKADIKAARASNDQNRRHEVHSFLLTDSRGQAIQSRQIHSLVCSEVHKALLGELPR